MYANRVSPPKQQHLTGEQHRFPLAGVRDRRCRYTKAAEVDLLVLELDNRSDLGKARDSADKRVFDNLTRAAGESEKLLGRQALRAQDEDKVIEPALPDRRNDLRRAFRKDRCR